MARTPAALILLLVAPVAFAQAVYRWVDAEGTTHYTDNAASIPKGVTVFATEGDPISEMGKPGPIPVVPRPAAAQARVGEQLEPMVPSASEQFWRGQFQVAREKIRALEDEIEADRHRVEDVNGLPVGISYTCAPAYLGSWPPVSYGTSIAVGPHGVKARFGPVAQAGYVQTLGSCFQLINPEYDRARARLETNRGALGRAQEELRDLERRAGFEAVPLQWRR